MCILFIDNHSAFVSLRTALYSCYTILILISTLSLNLFFKIIKIEIVFSHLFRVSSIDYGERIKNICEYDSATILYHVWAHLYPNMK